MKEIQIGFIGQGWIGKNYADDFEKRRFNVVRYSKEKEFLSNKDKIKECNIVFIAVPTPTIRGKQDLSIVIDVMSLVSEGTTIVIKSTVTPGTSEKIAKQFPNIHILHSPEFLTEKNAKYEATHPARNIIGMTRDSAEHKERAQKVLEILPKAEYSLLCTVREAELVKYFGNVYLLSKVVLFNIFYDMAQSFDSDWDVIRDAVVADTRIGESHTHPVHENGYEGGNGRGAGGHCLIKDFSVFVELYRDRIKEEHGLLVLENIEKTNNKLLRDSGKDVDLLDGVYNQL